MRNAKSIGSVLGLALFVLPGVLSLAGCGDPGLVKEDPAVAKKRMDAATSLRSYFDKSGGNFDALSAEDKQAVIALTNGEQNARTAFSHMVPSKKVGGAPGGGGLPATGPNNH